MLGTWDTMMSKNSHDLSADRRGSLVKVAINNIVQNRYEIATVVESEG